MIERGPNEVALENYLRSRLRKLEDDVVGMSNTLPRNTLDSRYEYTESA